MTPAQLRNYDQYIQCYAEPEARALRTLILSKPGLLPKNRVYASIPLCRENEQIVGCFTALKDAAALSPAVVVFVLNHRVSSDEALKRDNRATLDYLLAQITPAALTEHMFFGHVSPFLSILVVDRAGPGTELPEDQGVGLARKIGCDLATVMMCELLARDGFIRNTDGDARVARDFFQPIQEGPAAAIYPFVHEAKGDGVNAVLQYEDYLHYYVRAMAAAGSPYAFHTIGSTIACSVKSYIACRGFPKRDAGEDFYLLNKLAKDGPVVLLDRNPITLVARDSDRVPFGTGAACRRIEGLVLSGGVYKVYHPDCFLLLKDWLSFVGDTLDQSTDWLGVGKDSEEFIGTFWKRFCESAKSAFPEVSEDFLLLLETQLGLKTGLVNVLAKSNKKAVIAQHANIWFDGFRTMRFLNLARDHCFGEIPATEVRSLFVDH